MNTENPTKLLHGAIVSGIINAFINGIINWFQIKSQTAVFLSVDSISNKEHTVLGGAIILVFTLSFIIATISWFTLKVKNKPNYFPKVFLLALKNAIFLFGLFITLAILWQRVAGTMQVTPLVAAILVGIIAGIAAGAADYMTKTGILKSMNE